MLLGQIARPALDVRDEDEYVEVEMRLRAPTPMGTPVDLRVLPDRVYPEALIALDVGVLTSLAPVPYGEALGRQLFERTELGDHYTDMRAALEARGATWRLRLRLDAPQLEDVRWELLCHPVADAWAPVAAGGSTPFSRFVYVDGWTPKRPLTERPIRALFVAARAEGRRLRGLDAIPAAEQDAMRQALGAPGTAEIDMRELVTGGPSSPTLAALRAELAREPAIVHILCHGIKEAGGTSLLLEDETGCPFPISAGEVLSAFHGAATPPRLVMLAACSSSSIDGTRAFVSLGPALARAGVDAVVAMSAPIATDTCRTFCTALYQRLFTHGVIDRAVNEARAAVREAWDWGVPVLFSRLSDQQLLDFTAGRVHADYLDRSDRVARSAARGRAWGEAHAAPYDAMQATTELIAELEKSHEVLTKVTSEFRRTARDPQRFAQAFTDFRTDFKAYYDNKSWRVERTRCHEVSLRAGPARELVAHVLSDNELQQFDEDIARLSDLDANIIELLSQFLDEMDTAVDEIALLLAQSDETGALARHRTFDLQISPSFRRSKALLADLGERADRVRAA
jgi:CHAT domain-containing protein